MLSLLATIGITLLPILIAFLFISTLVHHLKIFNKSEAISTPKLSEAISTPILFVLAISPIGAPAIYIALSLIGICGGAIGSGNLCLLSGSIGWGIGWYLETVGTYLEVSFFFLIGFGWVLVAFYLWGLLLWRVVARMFLGSRR